MRMSGEGSPAMFDREQIRAFLTELGQDLQSHDVKAHCSWWAVRRWHSLLTLAG